MSTGKIVGSPAMTGPDTFSLILTAPAGQSFTYLLAFSPGHPEDGFPLVWASDYPQR
ncbi:hypothetical protein ABCS02_16770 [Microbacterium sp. X-17]|uniref:hypothetical protein n=1 Tax=Microbacterium sp. X-17 TaxID=3144404 RepID=UPI0031F54942